MLLLILTVKRWVVNDRLQVSLGDINFMECSQKNWCFSNNSYICTYLTSYFNYSKHIYSFSYQKIDIEVKYWRINSYHITCILYFFLGASSFRLITNRSFFYTECLEYSQAIAQVNGCFFLTDYWSMAEIQCQVSSSHSWLARLLSTGEKTRPNSDLCSSILWQNLKMFPCLCWKRSHLTIVSILVTV